MTLLRRIGFFLKARQRWVLIALLAVLHMTLLAGAGSMIGLMCWFVDVGFFILWQPFFQSEKRLDVGSLLMFAAALAGGAWLFSWWFLILWVVVLAALLGGRVMMLGHRPTRVVYLLAFAYLLCALLIGLMPKVVPNQALIGPSLDAPFAWAAPLIFLAMALMPAPEALRTVSRGTVDFFYSLFIFLLISVVILGSLAFMLLSNSLYIEAVFKTLVSMAAILLLIAWSWNPRPGFSGVGVFLSRYLLTIGLPFETWLQRLMDSAARDNDADTFLVAAFEGLGDLPWVCGGAWSPAAGNPAGSASRGRFGRPSTFCQEFPGRPLDFTLYTEHKLSPALIWHFHLLLQLTNEYYAAKRRARELQQVDYLRAVHETGARLTHDVKNLLQSLNNLCYAAQTANADGAANAESAERLRQLMQRQLPVITQRLQQTLEKLQQPQLTTEIGQQPAAAWWQALQQRYSHEPVEFASCRFPAEAAVASPLFEGVADNLLQNALLKRRYETDVRIRVSLSEDGSELCVSDTGTPVPGDVVADLFHAPVRSDNGLGIGLYHAARLAEGLGYTLTLAANDPGDVRFRLAPAAP